MEKKVYENNIENAERFLNNGMHRETDRNELVENVCSTAIFSAKTLDNPMLMDETEVIAKSFHTHDSLESTTEQIAKEFHTTPLSMEEYVEDISIKYNIDNDIVWKLLRIKKQLSTQKQKNMNFDELLKFFDSIMNYDEMQIWIMKQQMIGKELTLNDMLEKFFELKSDEDIMKLYDIEQNYNQNNINNIRESLSSVHTERMSEEPTLSQLLDTSKNMSEKDTEYVKKLMKTKIDN